MVLRRRAQGLRRDHRRKRVPARRRLDADPPRQRPVLRRARRRRPHRDVLADVGRAVAAARARAHARRRWGRIRQRRRLLGRQLRDCGGALRSWGRASPFPRRGGRGCHDSRRVGLRFMAPAAGHAAQPERRLARRRRGGQAAPRDGSDGASARGVAVAEPGQRSGLFAPVRDGAPVRLARRVGRGGAGRRRLRRRNFGEDGICDTRNL
mmetsp:Transcript_4272/g.13395  ORF Transcript_4272/g.13395 Transcript_4272/m.13395 type:complete len:209 (+) Transcript_4272:274-900(+)